MGCPGSGKSTLAKKLAMEYNLPLVHLDSIYWRENWTNISEEEFDKRLEEEMSKDSWIIDGNYNRTIKRRIGKSDTIIYLDYSRLTCIIGVIKRIIKYRKVVRSDMSERCFEKFDLEFIKFIWKFNKENRKKYYNILSKLDNKRVFIIKNRKELNKITLKD
jgi:adenylate kinase family enzyme